MEHQEGAYQPDGKTRKYLAQRVMPQNNPCRTEYAGYPYKQAQPYYRIIAE